MTTRTNRAPQPVRVHRQRCRRPPPSARRPYPFRRSGTRADGSIACLERSSSFLGRPLLLVLSWAWAGGVCRSPRPLHGVQRSEGFDEDLAVLGTVRRPDEPPPLHHFDDPRGAVVAEHQLALKPGRRAPTRLCDQADRLVVERILLGVSLLVGRLVVVARP